jgi:hypothetical protein
MNTPTQVEPKAGDYILIPTITTVPATVIIYHFTEFYRTTNIEEIWLWVWTSTGYEITHTGMFMHMYPTPQYFNGQQIISESKAKMLIGLWKKRT